MLNCEEPVLPRSVIGNTRAVRGGAAATPHRTKMTSSTPSGNDAVIALLRFLKRTRSDSRMINVISGHSRRAESWIHVSSRERSLENACRT